jgi:hypothetical protein
VEGSIEQCGQPTISTDIRANRSPRACAARCWFVTSTTLLPLIRKALPNLYYVSGGVQRALAPAREEEVTPALYSQLAYTAFHHPMGTFSQRILLSLSETRSETGDIRGYSRA